MLLRLVNKSVYRSTFSKISATERYIVTALQILINTVQYIIQYLDEFQLTMKISKFTDGLFYI